MKIVHITSVHRPFDTRIFHRECKTLAAAGYEVVLLTAGDVNATVDGIRVKSVGMSRSRIRRMTLTVFALGRAALREGAAVHHLHDPELLLLGFVLNTIGRCVIYDAHEDLPQQIRWKYYIKPWFRWPLARMAALVEWLGGRRFDAIVAATPHIAIRFPRSKTTTVQNFPNPSEFVSKSAMPYSERPQTAIYAGDITEVRGIREMVCAIELVPEPFDPSLVLAGEFTPPALLGELRKMPGSSKVKALGWQARQDLAEQLGRARAGLVVLHPTRSYRESQPLKLFEYMAAGIPIIASDFPRWREIVDGAHCGLLVDPLDPRQIADAFIWILTHSKDAADMGQRGREAVLRSYDWNTEAKKLLRVYDCLVG